MRKLTSPVTFGFLLLVYVSCLQAAPIQLSEADFFSQISGSSILVEDFEGYSPGIQVNPFIYINGTYHGPTTGYVADSLPFCSDGDKCLTDFQSIQGIRTFDSFPIDTAFWGTQIDFISIEDTFDVTAVGGSESLNFQFSPTGDAFFLGFYDPLGIAQIQIENLGTSGNFGNYSFDNITTASTAPVPEPATILLLGSGLAGMVGFGKRRFFKK